MVSLDDFELIRVIGRGSYAKVLMVELKKTQRIYAMKVIKKELVTDDEVSIEFDLLGSTNRGLTSLGGHQLTFLTLDCFPRTLTGCKPRSTSSRRPPTTRSWWACTAASRRPRGSSSSSSLSAAETSCSTCSASAVCRRNTQDSTPLRSVSRSTSCTSEVRTIVGRA